LQHCLASSAQLGCRIPHLVGQFELDRAVSLLTARHSLSALKSLGMCFD
jgi:hypothetical protein